MSRNWAGRRAAALLAVAVTAASWLAPPAGAEGETSPLAWSMALDPIPGGTGGAWGPVEPWPMIAIHAALDRDGRVVTYGTNDDGRQTGRFIYDRWTPGSSAASGHQTLPNTTTTDLFCSLQLNRVDTGDMLLFGGDNWWGDGTTNTGNPDINSLDPDSGTLTSLPGMHRPRWYATGVVRPDGSIYVQGGDGGADRPELWTPERGAQLLDLDTSGYDWWYPRNFVLGDGRIFGIDNEGRMFFVSPDLTTITPAGQLPPDRHGQGATAVMYRPGRILHFGGATNTAVVIDVTGAQPRVTPTAPLSSARRWVNATLLPDGRVLATGGGVIAGSGTAADIGPYIPNNTAEVWDPATGRWTVQSAGVQARLYHSSALLLPDGRVLVAGGGAPGPVTNTTAELFSPDYLVDQAGQPRPRPAIGTVSETDLVPGQAITLDVASGGSGGIARITLLKAGSVTHSVNMEQRLVDLPFTAAAGPDAATRMTTTLPANEANLTPGWYLLSVLDQAGVPSPSVMVRVASPSPDRPVTAVDGRIARLYRAYFLRPADDDGYRWWRRALLSGTPAAAVSDQFAASPEFALRYGSLDQAGFVDLVYGNVLGRAPDAEGRDYWIGQLARGMTRGQVMLAFAESAEFVALTATPSPDGAAPPLGAPIQPLPVDAGQVMRLYLGYFARLPDEAGLSYWLGQRATGVPLAAVSDAFVASEEFRVRYGGTSDEAFVDLIYANVLRRDPDPEGRAYWVAQLTRGMPRRELMILFTESPEFVTLTAAIA